MAANSVASPLLPLSLAPPLTTNSAWGVHRNWDRWLGKAAVTSDRDGAITQHIPEQWRKSLRAKEGGKVEEETRKYHKKKTVCGVHSEHWQDWEYGTPIRGKVAGYREMRCVVSVIWRRPLFFHHMYTLIWFQISRDKHISLSYYDPILSFLWTE